MQLVVMGLLFLFVLQKELIVFVKEFIYSLPTGSNVIEQIAIRGYVYFNLLANSPSLFAVAFVIIQVMLFACTITIILYILCEPIIYSKENIFLNFKRKENKFYRDNRSCYLENLSLLL